MSSARMLTLSTVFVRPEAGTFCQMPSMVGLCAPTLIIVDMITVVPSSVMWTKCASIG